MSTAVTVVIPTYNHGHFLGEAIDSVLAQSAEAAEVVVVDDGSSDGTSTVLDRYSERVRTIRQPNKGVSAARNAGASAARGTVLAFLDADDAWLPRKLERQTQRLASEAGIGLVHCGVQEVDAQGRMLSTRLDGLEGNNVWQELLLFRRGAVLGGGSAAMLPRRVFESVGGFDESLSTSADWDLYFRVSRRHPIAFVAEPLVRYRVHGGNMHGSVKAMERDMLRGYAKAFAEGGPQLLQIRRRAYGGLHSMLAGSYFRAGHYAGFARHAAQSIVLTPGRLGYFLAFPLRWARRLCSGSI